MEALSPLRLVEALFILQPAENMKSYWDFTPGFFALGSQELRDRKRPLASR